MVFKQIKTFLTGLALILTVSCLKAQNLITNGNFEKSSECPFHISLLSLLDKWESPNQGTPDFFCECSSRKYFEVGVPNNFSGFQYPHSGNCYIGIICYSESSKYKEYISIKLNKKLKKGKKYCLNFYYSLANYSQYKVNSLGALITSKKNDLKNGIPINISNAESKIEYDTLNWKFFCSSYTSKGKENYLTIGSFNDDIEAVNEELTPKRISKLKLKQGKQAYYYIDDVSITEIRDDNKCECEQKQLIEKDIITQKIDSIKLINNYDSAKIKPFVLRDVVFEYDKSELLQSSLEELNNLVYYLKLNEKIKIEISGYTDNNGIEQHNLSLSRERASMVANYLINHGISINRVTHNGYGSKNPIKPNNSIENKAINRRVEFKIITD